MHFLDGWWAGNWLDYLIYAHKIGWFYIHSSDRNMHHVDGLAAPWRYEPYIGKASMMSLEKNIFVFWIWIDRCVANKTLLLKKTCRMTRHAYFYQITYVPLTNHVSNRNCMYRHKLHAPNILSVDTEPLLLYNKRHFCRALAHSS